MTTPSIWQKVHNSYDLPSKPKLEFAIDFQCQQCFVKPVKATLLGNMPPLTNLWIWAVFYIYSQSPYSFILFS